MREELLQILLCPSCKGKLRYEPLENNPRKGRLICSQCQIYYPVEDGLPNLVRGEAKPLKQES